jgi:Gloeo_Verruco repeat
MRILQTLFLGLAIFSIDVASQAQWQLQQLCVFSNNPAQGAPSFITQGSNGNFYGTLSSTAAIGFPPSFVIQGRFFEMTPSGAITIFPATPSSAILGLNAELAPADDGGFYATTTTNSSFPFPSLGLIIKLALSGQISTAYTFNPSHGGRPSSLRRGLDGCFYGVTTGTNAVAFPPAYYKTIFQFATNNTLTTLYSVTNSAEFTGAPVQGQDGFLYGTTAVEIPGGPLSGSTYRVSFYRLSTNGNFTTLYTRSNSTGPAGELIFGSDGSLYGAIGAGSPGSIPAHPGSIFRFTTAGVFSNLFTFSGTNGFDPKDQLVLAADGGLYGTAGGGGAGTTAAIFHLSTNGGLTTLMTFPGPNEITPTSPLVQPSDGTLYCTASMVPTAISGMAFRLVPTTAISGLIVSNGVAALTWNSFTNGVYRVEYKASLSDSTWTTLGPPLTATDSTTTVLDNPTDSQRFYRVVLLP